MSVAHDLHSFLQSTEAELPHWTQDVAVQALQRLQGPGLGSTERREWLAVQAVLSPPHERGLPAAWERELRSHLWQGASPQPAPASADPGNGLSLETLTLLTLKEEQEVDEDIELSRLIQGLESRCESTLRDLRALCSALRGEAGVRVDAPPLHPPALAHTLGLAARSLPLSPAARLLLLRVCAMAASPVLETVLARQLQQLKAAGVQPVRFRVQAAAEKLPAAGPPNQPTEAPHGAPEQAPEHQIQAVLQQLLASAGPGAEASGQPSVSVSDAWMQGILQAVLQEASPAPPMREVMARLAHAGQQLARSEPALWRQPDHVWWQLLDRLMALCAVLEGQPAGPHDAAVQRCDTAVTRLCEAELVDSALCLELLAEVDTVSRTLALIEPAQSSAEKPQGRLLDMVRSQMSQQLRTSAAPSSLRRFLMGPWLRVITAALHPETGEPAHAKRYTQWVDELLEAVRHSPSAAALEALLAVARDGLAYIQMPESQVDTWLFDITMRLHEVGADELADTLAQWRHEDLPTVPIDLHGSVHGARARRDRVAWIRNLRTGDLCRLFLDTQWLVAQLVVDPGAASGKGDEHYVFQSLNPKRLHALTREALERLRGEGLAASIEQGSFIARALDTMAVGLDELAPKSAS